MSKEQTALLTFADFEKLPDTPGKQGLLDGELIELPPAKLRDMEISRREMLRLLETGHRSRVWCETGYGLKRGWPQPGVSVSWPDQPESDGYFAGAPMLAVEAGSRGNTAGELDRKIVRYFDEGAGEV